MASKMTYSMIFPETEVRLTALQEELPGSSFLKIDLAFVLLFIKSLAWQLWPFKNEGTTLQWHWPPFSTPSDTACVVPRIWVCPTGFKCTTHRYWPWAWRLWRPKDKPYQELNPSPPPPKNQTASPKNQKMKTRKGCKANQSLSTWALSMSFVTAFPARLSSGAISFPALPLLPMYLQKPFCPLISQFFPVTSELWHWPSISMFLSWDGSSLFIHAGFLPRWPPSCLAGWPVPVHSKGALWGPATHSGSWVTQPCRTAFCGIPHSPFLNRLKYSPNSKIVTPIFLLFSFFQDAELQDGVFAAALLPLPFTSPSPSSFFYEYQAECFSWSSW